MSGNVRGKNGFDAARRTRCLPRWNRHPKSNWSRSLWHVVVAFGISSPTTSLIRHSTRLKTPQAMGRSQQSSHSVPMRLMDRLRISTQHRPCSIHRGISTRPGRLGNAVCRSLPPGSFHYWPDSLDNARLVAFYCQCAVGRAADVDPDADAADYYGTKDELEPGLKWLRERARQSEASAQCDLIRALVHSASRRTRCLECNAGVIRKSHKTKRHRRTIRWCEMATFEGFSSISFWKIA